MKRILNYINFGVFIIFLLMIFIIFWLFYYSNKIKANNEFLSERLNNFEGILNIYKIESSFEDKIETTLYRQKNETIQESKITQKYIRKASKNNQCFSDSAPVSVINELRKQAKSINNQSASNTRDIATT